MTVVIWLACGFVVLHALAIALFPGAAMAVSYAFLIAAPALAAAAMLRQCLVEGYAPARGWSLAAAAMVVWMLGMLSSMSQDLLLGTTILAPTETMLIYTLYGVPLTYAIATVGTEPASTVQRVIDAVLAMTLGLLYFSLIVALNSIHQGTGTTSPSLIADLFDIENGYLVVATLLRFIACEHGPQRRFFGALAGYALCYALVAAYYNHHVALDVAPNTGSLYDVVVDVPFMLLVVLGLRSGGERGWRAPPRLTRFVRSASPQLLGISVLVVALFLIRHRFTWGAVGVMVALLATGLRSVLSQVRQAEAELLLHRDREHLAALASVDGLTGVFNRRSFEEALQREWHAPGTVALLLVDVDFFKQFNDRYGHGAGDDCLRAVAAALHRVLPPTGMAARYGGDEFALLLPRAAPETARAVADRLCAAIGRLGVAHEDNPHRKVTISVGVAIGGSSPADLVASADRALYAAKRGGRHRAEGPG
ncbi:GGDEF domain-containing protein [Dyella agri]|uniref:diguanylate cyclase n=1 Tax=Dyella agri TaxID=1926869 RepID=A0ABW8KHI5_9GAMM